MVAIVSPTPRHASPARREPLERPLFLQSPPIYPLGELPRPAGIFTPPRLMSPIHLPPSTMHKSNLSKASTPCSSTKRRRAHATTSRTTRRRHCARPDCAVASVTYVKGLHAFDKLPWISQIEAASPETVDAWDLADLSLLPSSGIGPVRNRRTSSSRSGVSPFGGTLGGIIGAAPQSSGLRTRRELLPLRLLPAADNDASDPRTPPPTGSFDPYEVTFRNLMPAFLSTRDECRTPASRPWAADSSPLLPSPM